MKEIMPVYIVMDVSESMTWSGEKNDRQDTTTTKKIDIIQNVIPSFLEYMEEKSVLRNGVKISLVLFNQETKERVSQMDYYGLKREWPLVQAEIKNRKFYIAGKEFKVEGRTYFGELFKSLRVLIDRDIKRNIEQGNDIYRPLVYFFTDGVPEGETMEYVEKMFGELTSKTRIEGKKAPVIFGVGVGKSADLTTLSKFGAGRVLAGNKGVGEYKAGDERFVFAVRSGVKVGDALEKLHDKIWTSILWSFTKAKVDINSKDVKEAVNQDDDNDYLGTWLIRAGRR